MTERIDLDQLDAEPEERAEDRPNRGDWFWRGRGEPDDESKLSEGAVVDETASAAPDDEATVTSGQPMPRVPRESDGTPVGIPVEKGGAGAGEAAETSPEEAGETPDGAESGTERAGGEGTDHGGARDEMTLAFTYGAITRFADPEKVVADASGWTDWLGIVGDVEAHVINKLQRDYAIDVDFFNGSGTGPAERLAAIDEHSMFAAKRMVVVGRDGVDEPIAEQAGWEFVPLTEAAEKSGWTLSDE